MSRGLLAFLLVVFAAAFGGLSVALASGSAPGDIVMDKASSANGLPAVVFPHWAHRQEFRCYACHPQPFEMKSGANSIDMAAIRSGEFCGRCHNGTVAFQVGFDTCRTCHSHDGN